MSLALIVFTCLISIHPAFATALKCSDVFGNRSQPSHPLRPIQIEALKVYANAYDLNQLVRGRKPEYGTYKVGEMFPNQFSPAMSELTINEVVPLIDRAIHDSRLNHDVVVYRGIRVPLKVPHNLRVGDITSDPGFMSTTRDLERAKWFAAVHSRYEDSIVFRIQLPKGEVAADLAPLFANDGTILSSEKEILLPRNKKFRVSSINAHADYLMIDLEPL